MVRACRRTWRAHNPDWSIRYLDRFSAAELINDCATRAALNDPNQPPAAVSDRIRIALLAEHGGVWVDATTYCLRPLNDWLFDVLGSGFFAFGNALQDRLLSSWFLAAKPGNYIAQKWHETTLEYWAGRKERHTYFWFHYLFGDEYEKNSAFRMIWDDTPKITNWSGARYHPKDGSLWFPCTERDVRMITTAEEPLLKLYHSLPPGEYPPGSVVDYLCRQIGV